MGTYIARAAPEMKGAKLNKMKPKLFHIVLTNSAICFFFLQHYVLMSIHVEIHRFSSFLLIALILFMFASFISTAAHAT